jgi:YD repeat-containing protein
MNSGRLATASIDLTDNSDSVDAFQETYGFDGAGNLTSDGTRTYIYSSNRLSQAKIGTQVAREFSFDSVLRWRTAEGPSTNPDFITYAYTGSGCLATYAKEADGDAPAVTAAYAYDAAGQRKTSTVTIDGIETTTSFTWYETAGQRPRVSWRLG